MRFYIVSILSLVILIGLFAFKPDYWLWFGGAMIVLNLVLLVFGIFNVRFQYFTKFVSPEGGILLTFDDGPIPGKTEQILDTLKSEGVRAMFFLIGSRVEANPELARRIVDEGHVIGNHTYGHSISFTSKNVAGCLKEIDRCNYVISELTGEAPHYFRPPFGVTNPHMGAAIRKSGLKAMGWSVRSLDTVMSEEKSLGRIKRKTNRDSVVLLHDNGSLGADSLKEYISYCKSKGFKFNDLRDLNG